MSAEPRLPIVLVLTPVYNESAGLAAYEEAVRSVLFARTDCIVGAVHRGRSDDSWRRICDIASRDNR